MKPELFRVLCLVFFLTSIPGPLGANETQNTIALEALRRLKDLDLEANPSVKTALLRVLEQTKGTPTFVELVRDFNLQGQSEALLEFALHNPGQSSAVEAIRMVIREEGSTYLKPVLKTEQASDLLAILEKTPHRDAVSLLDEVVSSPEFPTDLRRQSVSAMARTRAGAEALINLARENRLAPDVLFLARIELNTVPWPGIRTEAGRVLPLPETKSDEALPPVSKLVQMPGDPLRGAEIFGRSESNCIGCHQVHGQGIDFGPNLSEIGDKLDKYALFVAILDPSAGINFGYEGWRLDLADGEEAFGIIISETEEEIALKSQSGIVTRYKKENILNREKSRTSIMPEGLHELMTVQELADLVEFLSTLRKKPQE